MSATGRHVIVRWGHLQQAAPPTYHSWERAGVTGCGRGWYFIGPPEGDEFHAAGLHIGHAEKIGKPCKKCWPNA